MIAADRNVALLSQKITKDQAPRTGPLRARTLAFSPPRGSSCRYKNLYVSFKEQDVDGVFRWQAVKTIGDFAAVNPGL
jgi:hypothetical protein